MTVDHGPAVGEPTRCLLFPNPLLVQEIGSFAYRKRAEFMQSLDQPRLAIDVGADAIWVINPHCNGVVASVSAAQVTATPVRYRQSRWDSWRWSPNNVVMDVVGNSRSRMPYLVVSVPGLQPLTIGCRDAVSDVDRRFSWRDDVPVRNKLADYAVSGADWLTLVEKLGLTPYLA